MRKLTQVYVESEFLKRGWVLRSKYVNSRTKLDFTCVKGHEHSIKWSNFKEGTGCKTCSGRFITEDRFNKVLKKLGLEHVSGTNKNLLLKCSKGHQFTSIFWDLEKGHSCPECAGNKPKTQEFVKNKFAEKGWKLLSKYKNCYTKLEFICSEGHLSQTTWNNFRFGCGKCRPKKYEEHAAKVLDDLGIVYIREWSGVKNPNTGGTWRVDFYLPDHKLFVEIDEEHHKRTIQSTKDSHRQKIITSQTGVEFDRIDATKGLDHITNRLKERVYGSVH